MFKPERPDQSIRALGVLRRWGSNAAAAYTVSAIRCPERVALVDERGTLTFAEIARRTNALAHGLAAAGVREGDGVAIMCRNHRGFVEATIACAKLGASQLYLNTAFAGPADRRRAAAGGADGADLRRGVRGPRERGLGGYASLRGVVRDTRRARGRRGSRRKRRRDGRSGGSKARGPDRGRRPDAAGAAVRARPRGDPDLRHDRHAEGGQTQAARLDGAAGRDVLEDPVAGARDDGDRGADVPLLGLRALHARDAAGLDDRAAAPLRPRGDAARDLPAPCERAGGRAGDAAADHGAPAGDDRALRPQLPADHRGIRLGAAGRAGDAGDGHLRRRSLQPLRLDRGGVGDDRDAAGPARRPRHRGTPAAGDRREAARRRRPRGRRGRARTDLRGERDGLRGLHRRRRQGDRAGPDEHRRHGPLRRGRTPVRRWPRRRDDRLGRGERVPARGRGSACRPRADRGGRRDRRAGRAVRPAPEGVRGAARRRESRARRRSRSTSSATSPATRCRARWSSWRSCRATRPARCSSAS